GMLCWSLLTLHELMLGSTFSDLLRAAFQSGKGNIVAINSHSIDFNYIIYTFQCDPTHGKFNSTVKAVNRKCVIDRKGITIFQE
ncbi:hypothetical protein STEG23_001629, partial [Scotinomys teguina]